MLSTSFKRVKAQEEILYKKRAVVETKKATFSEVALFAALDWDPIGAQQIDWCRAQQLFTVAFISPAVKVPIENSTGFFCLRVST
jgi:hypothetical protein